MPDGVDGARARESSAASSARAATSIPFSHLTYAPRTSAKATNADDCLSCRVLGTSACAVGAAMVTWEVYREPRRVLSHKIAMGAFAAAFVALGVYRAVM